MAVVDNIGSQIRALRQEIGETYKVFAEHLGVALPTAVRYERERRPPPRVIARLEQIASAHGLRDLAEAFQKALSEELSTPATAKTLHPVPTFEEERFVEALLTVLRDPVYSKKAAYVRRALLPVIEKKDFLEVLLETERAIARLLKNGKSLDAIGKRYEIEEIARAFFHQADVETLLARQDEIVAALLRDGWSIRDIIDEFHLHENEVISCASTDEFYRRLSEYYDEVSESGEPNKE